ncbi:hypothetical protein ED236_12275 [Pseudomethylobacillus aquaticus]|uniref:Uncharacterized protein n=1 Tax=Pseudomethylobacillus aquaticus TaxID=2676064 RepID=A0A3N0UT63_9PROT|nr:hypothetical protein [Pseudomethylobacillus aquaticus]ROH83498.1 hypothetical protein ED236_12275 [Pseudomethylobacillus aquaticus]
MKLYYLRVFIFLISSGAALSLFAMDDYLDITKTYSTKFLISKHIDNSTVAITATFDGDGYQQLPPGDTLKVNGVSLQGKPMTKAGWLGQFQVGYSYFERTPDSESYEIVWQRAADKSEVRYVIPARTFVPKVPKEISLSQDLVIPFEGAALTKGDNIFARFSALDTVPLEQRWGVFLDAVGQHNQFFVSAASMMKPRMGAQLRAGPADFHIGISVYQYEREGRDLLVYAISQHVPVVITD